MKTVFIIIILFLLFSESYSQNLVPNPSFEILDTCPQFLGSIESALGWFSAKGTPDVYNSCALTGLNVPFNAFGYQNAVQGQGYSGILAYGYGFTNDREYLSIQLSTVLIVGQNYTVSFFISLADTFSLDCTTNNMGFKLSTIPYSITNPNPVDNFAHFHNLNSVADKQNWTKITGNIIADSAYTYLMIGNFYDDQNTDTLNCASQSYYYLDMVCMSSDSLFCESFNNLVNNSEQFSSHLISNIVNELLVIDFKNQIDKQFWEIYDSSGRIFMNGFKAFHMETLEININTLKSGIYYLRIKTTRMTSNFKFIKL